MSLTVSDIITGAELRAEPYVQETGTPKGILVRQLDGLDSEVVGWVALHDKAHLSTAASELTVVKATNSTGYSLESARRWFAFRWVDSDDNVFPFDIVDERLYDHPPKHPAAIIRAGKLYPCDPLEIGWETSSDERQVFVGNGDVIRYSYIPEHTQLTALSDTCESPDYARDYFESSLALSIVLSYPRPVPQGKMVELSNKAQEAKRLLLITIAKQTSKESSVRQEQRMY